MAEEIKNTASQGAAVSCDAISKEAQAAMIMKERVANNAWHKFCRNKAAVVGLVIVILMILMGVLAPVLAPYDPNEIHVLDTYLAPGEKGYIFGTDDLGRDILSRMLYGARMSVVVAIGSTLVGGILGIIVGLVAGYFGGKVDAVIMRIMDGMFAFPFILLAILLVVVLGNGVLNVILAIGIGHIPQFARVVRSKVIVAKNEEYCNAERILGAFSGPCDRYFKRYNVPLKASWGVSKDRIWQEIEDMLEQDLPVILSVGNQFPVFWKKKGAQLYRRSGEALKQSVHVHAHYVTVVGMDDAWLRISSWGQEYYLAREEFLRYRDKESMNLLCNIVRLRHI